jgi:hypothetical protein
MQPDQQQPVPWQQRPYCSPPPPPARPQTSTAVVVLLVLIFIALIANLAMTSEIYHVVRGVLDVGDLFG